MLDHVKRTRIVCQVGLVAGLAAAAVAVAGPAQAASYGGPVGNCYGISWETDWNQECGSGGAAIGGTDKTVADCTAPQVTDQSLSKYRSKGNRTSYDGADCRYRVQNAVTTISR